MKPLFALLITLITSNVLFAQQTVKVWGNCDMCKKTIEKAAVAAGAEGATWDKTTKQLTVPGKVDMKKIEQAVALVGYDTQNFTAKDEAYFSLPECCQYERKAAGSKKESVKEDCCKEGKCSKKS
jgi:periplasmic mercuric ion binding protein